MVVREAFHAHLRILNAKGSASTTAGQSSETQIAGPEVRRPEISGEYLAGFVDAEGALMIGRSKSRRANKFQYHARVTLSNTNREVLEDIQRTYSGMLFDPIPQKAEWKQPHVLIWTGESAEGFVGCVFPYLRVKRRQASVLLRFSRHLRELRSGAATRAGRIADDFSQLEVLHERMKEINAKGPAAERR